MPEKAARSPNTSVSDGAQRRAERKTKTPGKPKPTKKVAANANPKTGLVTSPDTMQHDATKKQKAKKTKPTKIAKPKEIYIFPQLNWRISREVKSTVGNVSFQKRTLTAEKNNEYSTFVMGKFTCSQESCGKLWSSGKVAILIRGYPNGGYDALVFNQRCKRCEFLGVLELDEDSYVERIVYRLKVWARVQMVQPLYNVARRMPPHETDLCEGCKRGICQEARSYR